MLPENDGGRLKCAGRTSFIRSDRIAGMKLVEKLTPDFLRPTWRCRGCGKTYRRNRRTCRNCEGTVFDRVR
ncbi:hypothetical protein DMJ13_03755 [halophilic archaeon]|nr:hypothetical protein DMJ13_03755 [halophilic archaeon]